MSIAHSGSSSAIGTLTMPIRRYEVLNFEGKDPAQYFSHRLVFTTALKLRTANREIRLHLSFKDMGDESLRDVYYS
jgi:hypothetical protein